MTVAAIAEQSAQKIPIWRTVKAAYRDTFANLGTFLVVAAVPFAISATADFALPEESGNLAITLARILAGFLAGTLFELPWLRHLLIADTAAAKRLVPPMNRRLLRYLGYSALLSTLYVPALFFQEALDETALAAPVFYAIVVAVFYLLASYLAVRFEFVFPWVALDAPERLGASWRLTRRNGLRILIAIGLAGLPLLLILFSLGILLAIFWPETAQQFESGHYEGALLWLVLITGNAFLFFFYALNCAILVRAFSVLTGWISDRRELLERFE